MMLDPDRAQRVVRELQALGVLISIDDTAPASRPWAICATYMFMH